MYRRTALIFALGLAPFVASSACSQVLDTDSLSSNVRAGNGGATTLPSSAGSGHAGTANAGGSVGIAGTGAAAGGTAATGTAAAGSSAGGVSNAQAGSGAAFSGSAGASGSSGGEIEGCPCWAPTPTCENGKCVIRGPAMIKATTFYVDSTEVTRAEYAAFQAAKAGNVSDQAAECSWNTSYEPQFVQGAPAMTPEQPVTNIDFCDAAAFCAWADKRLCGKIGGGSLALSELNDWNVSQWFVACAGPKGSNPYPYGETYQSGSCNDQTGSQRLEPVGTFAACAGYYPGLKDMLGNAQEWTDSCDGKAGNADGCERIGGSYLVTASCGESGLARRDYRAPELGFRCCSK